MSIKTIIAAILFCFAFTSINQPVCPDCGETNCIYQQINNSVEGEGTDQDIETAIYKVCKQRGIKDSTMIDLIKANYYL